MGAYAGDYGSIVNLVNFIVLSLVLSQLAIYDLKRGVMCDQSLSERTPHYSGQIFGHSGVCYRGVPMYSDCVSTLMGTNSTSTLY